MPTFIADSVTVPENSSAPIALDAALLKAFDDWRCAVRDYADDPSFEESYLEERYGPAMDDASARVEQLHALTLPGVLAKLRYLFREMVDTKTASDLILKGTPAPHNSFEHMDDVLIRLIFDVEAMVEGATPHGSEVDPVADQIIHFEFDRAADDVDSDTQAAAFESLAEELAGRVGGVSLARDKLAVLLKRMRGSETDGDLCGADLRDYQLIESALRDLGGSPHSSLA